MHFEKYLIMAMLLMASGIQLYLYDDKKRTEEFNKIAESVIKEMGGLQKPTAIYDTQGNLIGHFDSKDKQFVPEYEK